jgi:DNA-binding NarL/FixJ family response regulator
MTHQIFIVEDHPIMRQSLRDFLGDLDRVTVCGSASSAEEALELLPGQTQPDLIMVDVSLPGISGIELVITLKDRGISAKCLMLSGHSEPAYAFRAMEAGAAGYLIKGEHHEMEEGIRSVLDGGTYMSATLLAKAPGR